jgi:hypothetical protein
MVLDGQCAIAGACFHLQLETLMAHVRCKICHHPERARIELMRAGGSSLDVIAKRFGLQRDLIWRHWQKHVSETTKAQLIAGPLQLHELAERATAEGLSLLDYLSIIRGTLMDLFQHAAQAKDKNGASITSGRLLQCLEQIGRLTGELSRISSSTVVNNTLVIGSPGFAPIQGAILSALAPYPDARLAVVEALRSIEVPDSKPLLEAQKIIEVEHVEA